MDANKSGGYDFELVGDTIKEYECPICLLLIREAIELPCTHVLCKTCLHRWQQDCAADTKSLCPSCKVEYHKEKAHKSKITDRIITTSLKVKCEKNNNGCDWVGTISDYEAHGNHCLFKEVECLHYGCTQKTLRKDAKQHQDTCPYRVLKCRYCEKEMPHNKLQEHIDTTCPGYVITCGQDKCHAAVKRQDIESHLLKDCLYKITDCEFKSVGCDVTGIRKDLTDHVESSMRDHMFLLLHHTSKLTQKLESTQDNLDDVNKELKSTREDLRNASQELGNFKQELSVTKTEFRAELRTVKNELADHKTKLKESHTQNKDENVNGTLGVLSYTTEENTEGISDTLGSLFFSTVFLFPDAYHKLFKKLEESLPLNKYHEYNKNNWFIRIGVAGIGDKGTLRLGLNLNSAAAAQKETVFNQALIFRCENFSVIETGKSEFCIYLYSPSPTSTPNDISAIVRHPMYNQKKVMALYKTAIPVKGEFTMDGYILLQLISK